MSILKKAKRIFADTSPSITEIEKTNPDADVVDIPDEPIKPKRTRRSTRNSRRRTTVEKVEISRIPKLTVKEILAILTLERKRYFESKLEPDERRVLHKLSIKDYETYEVLTEYVESVEE